MKKPLEYDQIAISKWESFINSSKNAYFFQTPLWAKIVQNSYDYEINSKIFEINGIEIFIPMMVKKKYGLNISNSMPFGYGGIFYSDPIDTSVLQSVLKDILTGRDILFSISFPPFTHLNITEGRQIHNITWTSAHIIECTGNYQDIYKNFRRNVKRNLQSAKKHDLEIVTEPSKELYKKFYELYKEKSKEWGYSSPLHNWNFFKNIYKYGRPYSVLKLVKKDDEYVGGMISFEYHETIFVWGLISPFRTRDYFPNHILIEDIIQSGCNRNLQYINFGSSVDYKGVKEFKQGFGGYDQPVEEYMITSRLGEVLYKILNIGHFFRKNNVNTFSS